MASAITSAATSATTTTTAPANSTDSSRAMIAGNFNTFLSLLTTQLKNQNPLDPLNTNQFTQQLVEFASVEQQLKTNDSLTALLTSAKTATASNAASFIGLQVSADGATSSLKSGSAAWTINPARDTQATITITDAKGNVVASQSRALKAGTQPFTWDGRASSGLPAPEGDYTLSAIGRDATGTAVSIKSEIVGRVDGIDMSGDAPVLLVGSARVPVSKVKSIGGQ